MMGTWRERREVCKKKKITNQKPGKLWYPLLKDSLRVMTIDGEKKWFSLSTTNSYYF